jgi:hypothetical protein
MAYSKGTEKSQLTALKNTEKFKDTFHKLILENKNINLKDQEFILLSAILFFNFYNSDKRYKSYFKLAYYIVLKYSLLFKDLKPLYDISLQIGFYPICKTIVDNQDLSLNSISEIISHNILESKFINEREGYIETIEQSNSIKKLMKSNVNSLAYIAPTSFGKSSLISSFIIQKDYSKIGIIVPTKSLLIQTFKNIKQLNLNYKLILHDEMYENQEKFIGILTQERATRLINKGGCFDVLFIDEAHKIFEYNLDNSRGLILSRLIKMNKIKNQNQKVVYLSPLVDDSTNLKLDVDEEIESYQVNHNLKCENIFFFKDNYSSLYDKFTNEYIDIEDNINMYDYIIKLSKSKNFIFNYSPFRIEKLANDLYEKDSFKYITIDTEIQTIIDTLKDEVHKDFYINKTIEKGIIYIHAKMPNIIKEYLEFQFNKIKSFKYIIANTVILEGINLPIDNLFITSTDYQQGKDLVNLIGRVNRLNYVFKEKDLNKLISNIHFVSDVRYQGKNDMKNKINLLRDHSFEDKLQNPLLSEYNIDDLFTKSQEEQKEKKKKKDNEILINTDFIIKDDAKFTFLNKIKKYCIQNNIEDFYDNIDYVVALLESKINIYKNDVNFNNYNLIDKVYRIFIKQLESNIIDFEIERLKYPEARKYYLNYLEIVQKLPLKNNIMNTYKYFLTKATSDNPKLFIGGTFGETTKKSNKYKNQEYLRDVYVDLSKYKENQSKLINLAVVKLKIEEDFVSFKLNKLINFLFDFELITQDEYNLHTYGTTDNNLLNLSKIGLNVNLINKLIKDKQFHNIGINDYGNLEMKNNFSEYLEKQSELFKFEINKYIGINDD